MSVVFFFLTWREIEWGAEKISLRSFRQRRKVINTDSCRAKLESPTHNLMLYFTARCRFYQNNTRARSDQNASEQIASAVGLLQVCCLAWRHKGGQNVDPEVQLGSVWGSPDREDLRSLYQRSRHRGVLRRTGLSFLFQTVFPKTSLTSSGSGMFTPFVSELWSKRVISMLFSGFADSVKWLALVRFWRS